MANWLGDHALFTVCVTIFPSERNNSEIRKQGTSLRIEMEPGFRKLISAGISNETQFIGSIEFQVSNPIHAASQVIYLSKNAIASHIHLANAYTVALADKNLIYRDLLLQPAINYPDGKPIGWASKLKRQNPRLHQVRGPQLFLDVFDQGRKHDLRHYLLGSTNETLQKLRSNLEAKYPGVEIVGQESPPFKQQNASQLEAQDSRITASGAQIVWVGLGTPKQDFEVARLAASISIVAVAVGAAFDFAAGTSKEAPNWMSTLGLEWVFRLASEPRRLWKRYFFGNARFIKSVFFVKNQEKK